MSDVNEFDIPLGPLEAEPVSSRNRSTGEREAILLDALRAAGVGVGEYDERIVAWFAQYADWSTFATMTSWVERAKR